MDEVTRYLQLTKQVAAAEDSLRAIDQVIRAAGEALGDYHYPTTAIDGVSPPSAGIVRTRPSRGPASFDVGTWPTADTIRETLSTAQNLFRDVHAAWNAIPKEERQGLQAPREYRF